MKTMNKVLMVTFLVLTLLSIGLIVYDIVFDTLKWILYDVLLLICSTTGTIFFAEEINE